MGGNNLCCVRLADDPVHDRQRTSVCITDTTPLETIHYCTGMGEQRVNGTRVVMLTSDHNSVAVVNHGSSMVHSFIAFKAFWGGVRHRSFRSFGGRRVFQTSA